jgi:hypothetical protein
MDEPEFYKGTKKAGIYFVETKNYMPMRGNGWYSLPMIMYGLENKLIIETDIKHVIYSSLLIPKIITINLLIILTMSWVINLN